MIYVIHRTVVHTLGSGGESLRAREVHDWGPISAGESWTSAGQRERWESSRDRWAEVDLDWAGPTPLGDNLSAAQVMGLALGGAGGFRIVGAGLASGLWGKGDLMTAPDRRRPIGSTEKGVSCRQSSLF